MGDRLRDSVRRMVLAMVPELGNLGQWTYQVTAVTPGRPVKISARPVKAKCPYGPLTEITLWPGPDGGYATPTVDSLVLVRFNDGDPTDPAVCGLDPNLVPVIAKFGDVPEPLVPASHVTALETALTAFATGLNPSTLAGQASTLVTALGLLPPDATTEFQAT